jgi:glucosamine-6-phosphate deaminase
MPDLKRVSLHGGITAEVFESKAGLAEAAAEKAAESIRQAIARSGTARIVVATGNSQIAMIDRLVHLPGIAWSAVEAFHMDEYVGLPNSHPASFRLWLKTRFADVVKPRSMEYLNGDAADLDREILRYTMLLEERPLDVAFVGIGENGHIAFNDPATADFNDPATVKRAVLDEACRRQQVGEGHFPSVDTVPKEALTLTCPALLSARTLVCSVPDGRKAQAVKGAIEGEISTACPASILRTHPRVFLFLDLESASLLSPGSLSTPQ